MKKTCRCIVFLFSLFCIFSVLLIAAGVGDCAYPLSSSRIYTYEEMVKDLNSLESGYPEIVETTTIGRSVEGVPLHMIQMGKGDRKILVVGSQHAREWINTPLLMEMAEVYAEDYYKDREIEGEPLKHILNSHTFYIIPLANPDGVKLQQFGANAFPRKKYSLLRMNNGNTDFTRWKSNIRGVDLNRNWNVQWNTPRTGLISNSPGSAFYKGESPESEPEVKAIADWARAHNPIMALDFHSSGEVFFWYYYQTGRQLERDKRIVKAMERYSGYKAESVNENKGASTTFTRWSVMERKIPGICVENGVYTNTYQDMRNFNHIINKVRYLIPTAVINMTYYPEYVPVSSISLDTEEKRLDLGETYTLKADIKPGNASNQNVTWSSDNPRIASVDEQGNVTALDIGETTVRAETDDGGKVAACKITVPFVDVEEVKILREEIAIYLKGVNSRARVNYKIKPENATIKNVAFITEKSGIVKVDNRGKLKALSEGEETVTVVTEDGHKTASVCVRVIDDGVFYGDVNGDGVVDVTDAIDILRHITGLNVIEEEYIKNADVTKSNNVEVLDAIAVLRYIVGLY